MFTLNYYKILSYKTGVYNSDLGFKNTSGAAKTPASNALIIHQDASRGWYVHLGNLKTSLNGYGGVVFGDGDTPPAIDDYMLSGNILTTLSAAVTYSENVDETGAALTVVYTLTNTGEEAVTIKEVALMNGSGNSSNPPFLIERTVLDSPVTIEAGGVGQVAYTLRHNYPTA